MHNEEHSTWSVYLFVYDYSRTTDYEAAYEQCQQLQCYKGIPANHFLKIFLDIGDNFPGFSRVFRDDGSAMELVALDSQIFISMIYCAHCYSVATPSRPRRCEGVASLRAAHNINAASSYIYHACVIA